MVHWDDVTPGLCRISNELPRSYARDWAKVIFPILHKEIDIYQAVFQAYAFKEQLKKTNAFARKAFYAILEEEGLIFETLVISPVLNLYLDMCEEDHYWINGAIGKLGQHLPFNEMLGCWKERSQPLIQRSLSRLQDWKDATHS